MIHRISKSLPFELEYIAYLRLDLIATYPEMIDLLPDSGLRSAFFGIESFQAEGSKAIGKGWNGQHAKEFLLQLKEHWKDKTNWWMGMIVGLPGWSKEQEDLDLKWMIENDMSCWWHWALYINPANVINGQQWVSEFEKNYEKYGYKFTEDNFVNWTNGNLVHTELQAIAESLNEQSYKYKKVAGFRIGEFSTTLKCKMQELVNVRESEVPYNLLLENTQQFVTDYIRKNLE
jgi:coproporphyrinogen III oxidase-like Fe-S oxidoreductase